MKFNKIKKEYFIFSRKERNASIILIVIIAGAIVFPPVENLLASKSETADYSSMHNYFDSIRKTEVNLNEQENNYSESEYQKFNNETFYKPENETVVRQLFYFDPNKIGEEDWLRLGIKENIAKRIINYRNKGGVFRQKSDLLKTYGFSQNDFDALEDYIVIESVGTENKFTEKNKIPFNGERQITELNSATLDQLLALGFTKETANRILNFIKGVGGVYSPEQIKTIYGIDADQLNEILPFLLIDQTQIRLININSATEEELAKHSYISDELAYAIVEYRTATGRFVSVSEIMKIKGMYPALFEKLKPYLII